LATTILSHHQHHHPHTHQDEILLHCRNPTIRVVSTLDSHEIGQDGQDEVSHQFAQYPVLLLLSTVLTTMVLTALAANVLHLKPALWRRIVLNSLQPFLHSAPQIDALQLMLPKIFYFVLLSAKLRCGTMVWYVIQC
jgi:hypothetical protein